MRLRIGKTIALILCFVLVLAVPVAVQAQEDDQRDWETRVFQLEHADANTMRQILRMFRSETSVVGGIRVLSVKAPAEIMPAIEDTIQRLDVPVARPGVELTVYVLSATNEEKDDENDEENVPSQLDPVVVNELTRVLSYNSFQTLDTLVIRAVDGTRITNDGELPPFAAESDQSAPYSFSASVRVQTSTEGDPFLRLEDMRFGASIAREDLPSVNVQIRTQVEIPQGQQVVVGKATVNESAVVLVMNATFPD